MQIASLGEGKEARRIHLDLCSSTVFRNYGSMTKQWGGEVPKPLGKVSKPLMQILILPERFVLIISIFYKLVPRCGCVQLVELEVLVWSENLHASMKHD
ncbi:hypothetical protein GQ457_05G032780 [Hibiscus cannabinus]